MQSEPARTCKHEWVTVKECPAGCNVPLAGGVEDLDGSFCYGGDSNACNYSYPVEKCRKCGCNKE